jgi:hypothetical protein
VGGREDNGRVADASKSELSNDKKVTSLDFAMPLLKRNFRTTPKNSFGKSNAACENSFKSHVKSEKKFYLRLTKSPENHRRGRCDPMRS